MFCRACGVQNAADAGFCQQCGNALSPYAPPRSAVGSEFEASVGYAGYAGFWKRFAAFFIDAIVTGIVGGILGGVWGGFYGATHVGDPSANVGAGIGGAVIGIIGGWLYNTILESSTAQATVGKMALGIKVTDLEGRRISFARANGRYFAKFLSGLTLMIGYIMAGFTEKKQALHDMVAGCLVVNKS